MDHREFVEKTGQDEILWGVKGFYRPVRIVWGPGKLLGILALALLVLTPMLGFAAYCVWSARYGALIWTLPMILAFFMGGPGPNLFSLLPWMICFVIGIVCSQFLGTLHFVAGLLPGVIWFMSCALRGTTMVEMGDTLRKSAETYDRLRKSDLLIIYHVSHKAPSPAE
jgi:hypothetical protein